MVVCGVAVEAGPFSLTPARWEREAVWALVVGLVWAVSEPAKGGKRAEFEGLKG